MNILLLALAIVSSGPTFDKAFEYRMQVNVVHSLTGDVKTYESNEPFDFEVAEWSCSVEAMTDRSEPLVIQTHYTQCLPAQNIHITIVGWCYAGKVGSKYSEHNVESLVILSDQNKANLWVVTSKCTMAPADKSLYK